MDTSLEATNCSRHESNTLQHMADTRIRKGHVPPGYGARPVQAPGMMRHGPFPAGHRPMETTLPPNLENKLVVQEAEIERLAGDNRRLAASDGALRQDLGAAEQDIQRLRAHIRSIQTESDIQIRVLVDKIAKMEAEIRGGEIVKKELHQAHIEAQSLVADRKELTTKIEVATKELEKTRADMKKLPEMIDELDSSRKEHQRLRTKFEYEKGLNMEKFEEMQAMDQDLMAMSREIERLRSEVLNAEKREHVPNWYGGRPYMNPDPLYPPPMHSGAGYVDNYGRTHTPVSPEPAGEGMVPYGSGGAGSAPGGGYAWGGAYDTSHPRR